MLFATASLFAQSQFRTGDVIISEDKLRFLDSLNKYRTEAGVPPVKYSFEVDSLPKLRLKTILDHLQNISEFQYNKDFKKHLHHNFFEDATKFDKENIHADSTIAPLAECSARLQYDDNLDTIAKLFQGWKNSPSHWDAMMDSQFIFVSIYFEKTDKGFLASLVLSNKNKLKKK